MNGKEQLTYLSDDDMATIRHAADILGSLETTLAIAKHAFNEAFDGGAHTELQLAGLCRCEVIDEEFHADPEADVQVVDLPDDHPLAQTLRAALSPFHQLAKNIRAAVKQPAEPTTERPFVACKAPDPNRPNWFCCREIGHPEGEHGCVFAPIEKIPASADDEGAPVRYCQACDDFFGPLHACFEDEPGQEGAENANDPAFVEVLQEPEPVAACEIILCPNVPVPGSKRCAECAPLEPATEPAQPECPNRPYHGNPFRYCPTCPWVEAPDEQ